MLKVAVLSFVAAAAIAAWPMKSTHAADVSSRTLEEIIHGEKRFVLYNSRRLSGECLPICEDPELPSPTGTPTGIEGAVTQTPTGSSSGSSSGSSTGSPTRFEEGLTPPPIGNPTGTPTGSPTGTPTGTPTGSPTGSPTGTPTGTPTGSPTGSPTGTPTGVPTGSPTGSPTGNPTGTPVPPPTNGGGIICEDLTEHNNLGFPFSEAMHDPALGSKHWNDGCFPMVHNMEDHSQPRGFDDAISVFAGGNFIAIDGAEVEGNIVALGNFEIKKPWESFNLISAGWGTQVTPNFGGKCVQVGGYMSTTIRLEVYFQKDRPSYNCEMVSKGEARNKNKFPNWQMNSEGFDYRQDPNLDLSKYEEQKKSLIAKSEYWSTFPSTPGASAGLNGNKFTFTCSSDDVIQVFNVRSSDLNSGLSTYLFGKNCHDKTILINVQGTGTYTAKAKEMYWTDASGSTRRGGHQGFDSCMNSNILWNFYEAGTVNMVGDDEWQGSILVNGNFGFKTIGQSGRTMVVGNIIQDKGGSEFHSFEFRPPKPLPSPDCDDFVPSNPVPNPTDKPVSNPVPNPTDKPVSNPVPNPTDKPVSSPVAEPEVNPGTFCHALNDRDECGLTGPGSCAVQPGPRTDEYPHGSPSCGIGVPEGYYPDLTRCDAYCFCTGTAAPSRYEIVDTGEYYDHHNDWSYLHGKWGKDGGDGAYGTIGGIPVHKDGGMSWEGTLRPPGTCGPPQKCDGPNDNKTHPYNGCTQFFQCENGKAHLLQDCPGGTLFDGKICDHSRNVKCEDGDSGSNPVPNPVAAPVSPPPTNNEPKCNGNKDNSIHPWNGCTQFFHCQNGYAHDPQDCPPGLLFDDNAKVCNWPASVNCKVP